MIRRSRVMLAWCAGAALALHGVGLWLSETPAKIEIAGSAGAMEATLGSSFADMVAGAAQPVSNATVTPNRQADEVVDPTEPGEALRPDPPPRASTVTPPDDPAEQPPPERARTSPPPDRQASSAPQETAGTARPEAVAPQAAPTKTALVPARADLAETTAPVLPASRAEVSKASPTATPRNAAESVKSSAPTAVPPADRPERVLPTLVAATPRRDTPEAAEVAPKEVVEPDPGAEEGVQVSRRPQARPRKIEEATAARQSPEPEQREPRSRSTSGNNATRDATAGSATGRESAASARQGNDTARRSETQGNAAAGNYPGQVMRHLARVPRPRATARGAALVRFTIAAGGRLASVGLARSSGSGRLDRSALTVVRRAAPFPAPPAGAQRSFSVRIEGR